jgi:hypothetical protein
MFIVCAIHSSHLSGSHLLAHVQNPFAIEQESRDDYIATEKRKLEEANKAKRLKQEALAQTHPELASPRDEEQDGNNSEEDEINEDKLPDLSEWVRVTFQ